MGTSAVTALAARTAGLPNATRQAMATAINAIAPTYQTQDVAAYPNANIIGGVNYGEPVPYTYGG